MRFASVPTNTMFAFGTRVVFDEVALILSEATGVSMSPTVNGMSPVGVFFEVLWLRILLIVGGSFTAETVNTNVSVLVAEPSLTVTVIVAVLKRFVVGVICNVRFVLLPPERKTASGNERPVR